MLTLREAVIEQPFRDRRYRQHRRKVASARPRIDATPPCPRPHLSVKLRQLRIEEDRQSQICDDNIRLAHRMALIMRSKRVDNYNSGPVGPYVDVCPRLPSACPPRRFQPRRSERSSSSSSDLNFGALVAAGSTTVSSASSSSGVLRPVQTGRRVLHRAPAGWCVVPRVGSAHRSPTPPLPHTRACLKLLPLGKVERLFLRAASADKVRAPELGGLSVRRQLEPLVKLSADSPQDTDQDDDDELNNYNDEGEEGERGYDGEEEDEGVEEEEEDEKVAQDLIRSSELAVRKMSFQRKYSVCADDSDRNASTDSVAEDDPKDTNNETKSEPAILTNSNSNTTSANQISTFSKCAASQNETDGDPQLITESQEDTFESSESSEPTTASEQTPVKSEDVSTSGNKSDTATVVAEQSDEADHDSKQDHPPVSVARNDSEEVSSVLLSQKAKNGSDSEGSSFYD